MKFYYLRFWKNQRIFCLTIRVKFLLPRKRFADARKSTFGKTFMVLLIAKIDTPWNYRFSSKFVKSYTSSIFAKNKCICKNLQSHKTFSGFSNIFFKNSRSTIEGNKKKYLKSKRKREHVFKRNRNIIYFYQKIKRDRKRLRPNLVLFFLNDHRPSKRLPSVAKGLRPTLFTLWKIRAVSPIKERREIDTVSDTCSIGPRKYRELHERFGARCVQNGRSNKKRKSEREKGKGRAVCMNCTKVSNTEKGFEEGCRNDPL